MRAQPQDSGKTAYMYIYAHESGNFSQSNTIFVDLKGTLRINMTPSHISGG